MLISPKLTTDCRIHYNSASTSILQRVRQVISRLLYVVFAGTLLFVGPIAHAEQQQQVGGLEVHYSAFPSTLLSPAIATQYGLTRSAYRIILNVTALDPNKAGKPAQAIALTGTAQNLIGNTRELNFRSIQEGEAHYYLAEIPVVNEETYRFSLQINRPKNSQETFSGGTLQFQQTFYTDQ
ncbi:MAG: DUF4426 domain-containing protein [Plesiomonas sp.]